jgi:hypothetical protein
MAAAVGRILRQMGRSYSEKDLKILFGAGRMCAFPGCHQWLVVPATDSDPEQVIGKICHIVAHSDDGPRGDPEFPEADREKPDNLILLCGTHHDMIDVQPNTYSSADLRRWKMDHEHWVVTTLSDAVVALTFAELEAVAAGIVAQPPGLPDDLLLPTPPARKMRHNGLTALVAQYYVVGQLRFVDIERFIGDAGAWDPAFGERLAAGFRSQYDEFWARGLRGDDLYIALASWASGGVLAGFPRQAAGVAILSYLFHICDVFERAPDE